MFLLLLLLFVCCCFLAFHSMQCEASTDRQVDSSSLRSKSRGRDGDVAEWERSRRGECRGGGERVEGARWQVLTGEGEGGLASSTDSSSTFPPSGMRSIGIIGLRTAVKSPTLPSENKHPNHNIRPTSSTGFGSQAKLIAGERVRQSKRKNRLNWVR